MIPILNCFRGLQPALGEEPVADAGEEDLRGSGEYSGEESGEASEESSDDRGAGNTGCTLSTFISGVLVMLSDNCDTSDLNFRSALDALFGPVVQGRLEKVVAAAQTVAPGALCSEWFERALAVWLDTAPRYMLSTEHSPPLSLACVAGVAWEISSPN